MTPSSGSAPGGRAANGSRRGLGPAEALLHSIAGEKWRDSATRPDLAGLAAVQGSIMRNYFRLLRAQEELERRTRVARVAVHPSLIEESERERARLAHELHATAGQALAGIKIHLELIDSVLPDPPEQVRASLHRIGLLAQEALGQLRGVAHRIHPPDWERSSLSDALRNLWDTTGIPGKFQSELELVPMATEPPYEMRVLLYRVAQEGLANVVRHAQATKIRMWLGPGASGRLQLIVEDNGTGFDARAVTAACGAGGIGLRSMGDQLQWSGGGLAIESGAEGTRLIAWVPGARA